MLTSGALDDRERAIRESKKATGSAGVSKDDQLPGSSGHNVGGLLLLTARQKGEKKQVAVFEASQESLV